jgi:hypothetical protein
MRLVACLATVALALPAAAAERLASDPAVDVPLAAAAAAIYGGLAWGSDRQALRADPPAAKPGGIDALAVLRLDRDLSTASDVAAGAVIGGAALATAWDGARDGEFGHRLLLLGEALAISGAVNETVKYAVRRPRPYTYDRREGKVGDDISFYSGHTTQSAAATVFLARSLDLTGDLGPAGRVAAYGGAAALTAAVGTLRVLSGRHYPSDVLVGAVVGGAIGWLVPELHRRGATASAGPGTGGAGLTLLLPL